MSSRLLALAKRLVFEVGQIKAQGTAWYARKQLARIWRARSTTKSRRSGFREEPAKQAHGQQGERPLAERPPLRVQPHVEEGDPECTLRDGAQQQDETGAQRCPPKLRLVEPYSTDSE